MSNFQRLVGELNAVSLVHGGVMAKALPGEFGDTLSELRRWQGMPMDAVRRAVRMARSGFETVRGMAAPRVEPAPRAVPRVDYGTILQKAAADARSLLKAWPAPQRQAPAPKPKPSLGQQVLDARRAIADAAERGEISWRDAHEADARLRSFAGRKVQQARRG